MPINIDWVELLRSQQADFIQRLKSGNLLHSEIPGQHSELTVISGDRLKQLRDFCWQMAEKYKRTSPVRQVFINHLKGKLGEEVVKARLSDFVTEVDYEQKIAGDGKIDFTLAADSSIGIQVKARHGNIDKVQWSASSEEIEKNVVLVCILIQEEVNEAQTKYNLVLSGFMPTELIKLNNRKASVSIDELLYCSGLKSFLESTLLNNINSNQDNIQSVSTQKLPVTLTPIIKIGSWQYSLSLTIEELINMETAIKQLKEEQLKTYGNNNTDTKLQLEKSSLESFLNINEEEIVSKIWKKVTQGLRIEITELNILWQIILQNINPAPTQKIISQHCFLLDITNQNAIIGVNNQMLLKLVQARVSNIENAFINKFNTKLKFTFQVGKTLK